MNKVKWLDEPEEHDYPAALDYLDLVCPPKYDYARDQSFTEVIIEKFQISKSINKKAKDILRASNLPLLPKDNFHVKRDLEKIYGGKALSPVLLVRPFALGYPLIIADGYHRVCASYWRDENTDVSCRLV